MSKKRGKFTKRPQRNKAVLSAKQSRRWKEVLAGRYELAALASIGKKHQ